jgi:hypothetical protein
MVTVPGVRLGVADSARITPERVAESRALVRKGLNTYEE